MQNFTTDWNSLLTHFSDPNCQKEILSQLELLCEKDEALSEALTLFTGSLSSTSRVLCVEERVAAATCARYFLCHHPLSAFSPSFQMDVHLSLLLQQLLLLMSPADPSVDAMGAATRVTLLALLRAIATTSVTRPSGALVVRYFAMVEREVCQACEAASAAAAPFLVTRVAQLFGMLAEDLAPELLKLQAEAFGTVTFSICHVYEALLSLTDQLLALEISQGGNLFFHGALVDSLTAIMDSMQVLLSEGLFLLSPAVLLRFGIHSEEGSCESFAAATLAERLAQRVQAIHHHVQHRYVEQALLPSAQHLFASDTMVLDSYRNSDSSNCGLERELAARKSACVAHISIMAYSLAVADADDTYFQCSAADTNDADENRSPSSSSSFSRSMLHVTIQIWQCVSSFTSLSRQSSSDLQLDRVVVTSMDFLAEWAAHAPASLAAAFGLDDFLMSAFLSALYPLLCVPSAVATAEDRVGSLLMHVPDEVSAVRVALAKDPAKRHHRRPQAKRRKGADHLASSSQEEGNRDGGRGEEGMSDEDEDEDEEVAVGLDTLFEDNGSRRRAAAWMLSCFSFAEELLLPLQQALLPMALSMMQALESAYDKCECAHASNEDWAPYAFARMNSFLSVEAVLFLFSQIVEELLCAIASPHPKDTTEASSILTYVEQLTQLAMQWLNRFQPHADALHLRAVEENVPFYFRITVVGLFSRLFSSVDADSAGALEAGEAGENAQDDRVAPSSVFVAHFVHRLGGVESMLSALVQLSLMETNKMAVEETLEAVQVILLTILTTTDIEVDDDDDDDESDEEEEDDDNDDDKKKRAGEKNCSGGGNNARLCSLPRRCDVASTLLVRLVQEGVLTGRFQLGARVALYRLLEKTVPSMASHLPPGTPTVMTILELLAQYYMQQCGHDISNSSSSVFTTEGECLLSCLCELCEAAGKQLAPALPWVVQVARAVLRVYVSLPPDATTMYTGTVDAEDVAMLALDLLSGCCGALLDRDSSDSSSSTDDPLLLLLRQEFGQQRMTEEGGETPVALLCLEVLERALGDIHRHQAGGHGGSEDAYVPGDAFRRACFAILYDCVYLFPTHSSFIARVHRCCIASLCLDFFTTEEGTATTTAAEPHTFSSSWVESTAVSNGLLCWADVLRVMDQHSTDVEVVVQEEVLPRTAWLLQALLSVYTPAFVQYSSNIMLKINLTNALLALLMHAEKKMGTAAATLLSAAAQLSCLLGGVKLFLNEDDGTVFEFRQVSLSLAQVLLSVVQQVLAGTAPPQLTTAVAQRATVAGIKWWLKGCALWDGGATAACREAWRPLVQGATSHGWLSLSLQKQAEKLFS